MPPRSAKDLTEGGRELREARLAELRRQLEEKERASTPFKPTIFTGDRYSEVRLCSKS